LSLFFDEARGHLFTTHPLPGMVNVWDYRRGELVKSLPVPWPLGLAPTPAGEALLASTKSGEVYRIALADLRTERAALPSGAIGNASHLGPDVEAAICKRLGLDVAPVASQVIQRDRHAQYVSTLAIVTATLEKIALEIRHLQRTEVREAEEPFGGEQRGSSAMPHKRNPVSSEQVCGLARVVRANAGAAFENIALWHERDISHSSVERVILPDSTILADYLLARMTDIVSGMRVFPERMRRNLDATGGLVFSGQLMLDRRRHL
jgi:adenylosuccinate lyase